MLAADRLNGAMEREKEGANEVVMEICVATVNS